MLRWQALVTASSRVTSAQLTLSTPPQMPQLLADTDSLRLVPIVATCSVLYVLYTCYYYIIKYLLYIYYYIMYYYMLYTNIVRSPL